MGLFQTQAGPAIPTHPKAKGGPYTSLGLGLGPGDLKGPSQL